MTWVVKNIWCYWGKKLFPSYVYTNITEIRHISELTQIQNTSTFSFPIHLSLLSLSQRNVSSNAIGEKYSWTFLFEANKDFSQRECPGKKKKKNPSYITRLSNWKESTEEIFVINAYHDVICVRGPTTHKKIANFRYRKGRCCTWKVRSLQ